MSTQILATKLYTPVSPPGVVVRPRLIDRINAERHSKLILVSAPAGFGKTTLVTEWITSNEKPAAWLSLDEADGEPVRFLMYVVAALRMVMPHLGDAVSALLEAPQPPPIASLLTPLLNELAKSPRDVVLVLDDYHVIDNQEIDTALTFLIENMPPQIHLVIVTREDPRLPLARLRARGQLAEFRASDLRFTLDESTEFLNHKMGLTLSPNDVAALEVRTEGWIAGLQLAALSLRQSDDTSEFIQSFTSSNHFILDYLVEEVLNHQPAHIQEFLLRTAILDRMCGPLCDAVLQDDKHTAQTTLESIEQANLFLVPLDNERRWYRYHHLFGDLLRKRLGQLPDVDINELHIRASLWYETNDLAVAAFQHAAAANDLARAERLIEGQGTPLYLRGSASPVLKWFESLPESALDANPSLWIIYATVLTVNGQQIDSLEDKLHTAEIMLGEPVADDRSCDLHGRIAVIRGLLAGPRYDIEAMLSQSSRALELLHPDNLSMRTLALWTKGLAHQHRGEHEPARRVYAEVVSIGQVTGNTMMVVAALTCIGQLQEAEHQPGLAQQSYQRVLALIGEPPWPSACEAYLGLARVHYIWSDLDQAGQYAQQGVTLGRQIENVDTPIESGFVLARVQIAQGDLRAAASTLADCESLINARGLSHLLPQLHAEQARLQQQTDHTPSALPTQALLDPLSEREQDVLRLVAEGLTNREIGEQLFLALDTIKGHNRRIYAKLGVSRRTEAIARARELGLL